MNLSKKFSGRPDKSIPIFIDTAMNQTKKSKMSILALAAALTMASFAFVPGQVYATSLIDADVANVDCDQEQKTTQDTDQVQVADQDNNQSSDQALLSEQKAEQDTDQSDQDKNILSSVTDLLSGNQNSEESAEQENEQDSDQDAENNNAQVSGQSNSANQECSALGELGLGGLL
jgi:hypothetical protein